MRNAKCRLIFFLALASCTGHLPSYDRLETELLSNLAGSWQVEGQQTFEDWTAINDSTYYAVVYDLEGNDKIVRETIRIVRDGEKVFYEATVNGQNEGKPIRFQLARLTPGNVIFANPGHDFPKKIEYELPDHHHLVTTVSDGKGAKGKSFTLNYKRVMVQKKVTGIGGIFFKCKDPLKMTEWYSKNLGLATNEYGSMFEFRLADDPRETGYLQWSPFSSDTKYFEPSEKEFMINYRVENLERLVEELRNSGVTILDTIEVFEYGKFVHVLDPENNKIELWEPVDSVFTPLYKGKTTK